jgi:DNA-binding NtrC family response regulator
LLSEPPKLPIVTARANQTSQQTGAALLPTEQIDIREGFNNAKTKAVDQFERQYLSKLLAQVEGNISQAARIAKKERRSFTRLLEKHQFCRNDFLPTNS